MFYWEREFADDYFSINSVHEWPYLFLFLYHSNEIEIPAFAFKIYWQNIFIIMWVFPDPFPLCLSIPLLVLVDFSLLFGPNHYQVF